MNDVAMNEIMTLQAIFPDSFEQIDDKSIQFTFPSNHYNQDFIIQITFSQNYPREPLESIKITSGQISSQEQKLINEMLNQEQLSLVNDDEGFIFQLVNKIDDEEVVQKVNYQDNSEDSENSDNKKQRINHGQLAGIPLTKENFYQMQQLFIKENKINMAEDKDFTKIDFSLPQPQICTGYELFKRKDFKSIETENDVENNITE